MPIRSTTVPAGTPKWGSEWKRAAAHYYQRNFSIRVGGGCQSYRQNYLDLDPTYRDANGLPLLRMTFGISAHRLSEKFADRREIAKGVYGDRGHEPTRDGSPSGQWLLGTTTLRQSSSPQNSFTFTRSAYGRRGQHNPGQTRTRSTHLRNAVDIAERNVVRYGSALEQISVRILA